MEKEIVIGTNIEPVFSSFAMWYYGDAAQNSLFYILKEHMSDTRIYIYKESDEGTAIEEWLSHEENRNNKSVQRKALELLLPRLSVDEFFKIIDKEKKLYWDNGYSQAQYDIRKSLGL